MGYVYCAVRTEYFNIISKFSSLMLQQLAHIEAILFKMHSPVDTVVMLVLCLIHALEFCCNIYSLRLVVSQSRVNKLFVCASI